METTVLLRLKESIARQKQSLSDWLNGSSPQEVHIRVGPAGEQGLKDHLQTLDSALKKADENTLGLCDVCHDYVDEGRLEMDYTACVCLEHLSVEERSRLENDLELSQKVQRALLPQEVPSIRGLEIAAFSRPARIVGGDYFDFVKMSNGSYAFVIADVMGKGMPASMLMASLQASLRIIAPESKDPASVVHRLNHLFCHNIHLTKFVTFFIGHYDEHTRALTYCNAGHNPPLIYRADGTIRQLLPTGAAIGLVEHAEYTHETITLQPGDRLILYTDGIVESQTEGDEIFGQHRLEEFLRNSLPLSPQQTISSLREHLQQFSGTTIPVDDTTVIAVRVAG